MLRASEVGVLAALALTLGLHASADNGKIYECRDAKGEIIYQDEPCSADVPPPAKIPVAKKPPVVAKPKPKPPVKAPPPPQAPRHLAPPPSGPVDSRWASPEKALKTFLDAVTAGDRVLVVSCLTSDALADLGPDPESLPLNELRETVGSFTGYVSEGDLGPFWSIRALRAGLRPKWIFFERTMGGEWKIGGF